MNNIWILYFFILVIAEILAIFLLTEWSKYNKLYLIILGIISYIAVAVFFALIMKNISGNKLTILNTIWQIAGLIGVVLLGTIFYSEKLHYVQWIAVVLTIIAAVLLGVGEILRDT